MDVPKNNMISVPEEPPGNITWCENGQSLRCDKCQSPYAIDPAKRKKITGKNVQKPKFRKRLDPATNKILTLCNKCGLSMSRAKRRPPKKPLPTQEDKNGYLMEAEAYACSLAERLNEPDAKRLYCPHFKTEPCGCLQKYLQGKDGEDPSKADERALKLVELLKKAKHLSNEKMLSTKSVPVSGARGMKEDPSQNRRAGKRHSVIFEDFVLSHRVSLREELHLCERASQRVLLYSNNFLHKELKSMKSQRIERKTGKFVKGLLKPITELPLASCCNDKCVKLATSHPELLEFWRKLAQRGQQDARRVLAEMLTNEEGSKTSCYKFISLVTGCSLGTISSVNKHMRKMSGSKEPPEHGLKRWWRDNPRRRKANSSDKKKTNEERQESTEGEATDSDSLHIATKPPSKSPLSSKDIPLQSADIRAVAVLEVSRSSSDPIQITSLEEIAKEIMIPETGQSTQEMAAESLKQIIRVCHPSTSGNPNLLDEKDLAEFACDTTMLRSDGDKVLNVHAETVPSRQHMQILEVPLSESSSQTSVITSLTEKSQPQTTSLSSPSSHVEFSANGVPVLVPYVVLLPGIVILDPSLIGTNNIANSTD